MRAHMRAHEHVARQNVAFLVHVEQLCGAGERGECAISVGYESDAFGTRSQTAQATEQADGRRVAAARFAMGAGNANAHHVGSALGAFQRVGFYGAFRVDGLQITGDNRARSLRRIEQFVQFDKVFEEHGDPF